MSYFLYRVSTLDGASFESIISADSWESALEALKKSGYDSVHILCELKNYGICWENPHRGRSI